MMTKIKVQVITKEEAGIKPYVPIFKGTCAKCGEDYNNHGVRYSMIFCPDDVIVKCRNRILAIDPDVFTTFFERAKA